VNAKRLWWEKYGLKARLPLTQDFVLIWNSNKEKRAKVCDNLERKSWVAPIKF
jgi:hypothetical protein